VTLAAAIFAGPEVAAKLAKMAGEFFVKGVAWKRRMIAREELEAGDGKGKDLDGDGVVGGVGAAFASASGCAVSNGGALTANGRFWSKAGRITDRLAATKPYMNEEAHLVDPDFAGDPAAPCPQPDTVGSTLNQEPENQ